MKLLHTNSEINFVYPKTFFGSAALSVEICIKYFVLFFEAAEITLYVPNTFVDNPCLALFSKNATCFSAAALKTISGLILIKSEFNRFEFSIFVRENSNLLILALLFIDSFSLKILYSLLSIT